MLIEERGLGMVRTKTEIGEHSRIKLSSAEFDVESGKLRLKFKRVSSREQGMLEEEEIVWPARVSSFNRIEALDPVSHIPFPLALTVNVKELLIFGNIEGSFQSRSITHGWLSQPLRFG